MATWILHRDSLASHRRIVRGTTPFYWFFHSYVFPLLHLNLNVLGQLRISLKCLGVVSVLATCFGTCDNQFPATISFLPQIERERKHVVQSPILALTILFLLVACQCVEWVRGGGGAFKMGDMTEQRIPPSYRRIVHMTPHPSKFPFNWFITPLPHHH